MRIILYDQRSNLIRVAYQVIDGHPVPPSPQSAIPLPPGPVELAIRSHHSHILDTMIYEPLISRDDVIGVMEIHQGSADSFDEVNVTLLSTVAAQAAVALDNAYLYAEVQRYASELEERVQERTAKLQEALRKSQEVSEMRSRFLSNVQHEFRTPLTLILSASELLENHGAKMTQEQRDSRHNTIREAVKEMVRLLDSSMIINQIDDGMLPMLPQATNVAMLTEACVQDFLRSLPQIMNAGGRGNGAGSAVTTTAIQEKVIINVEQDGDCSIAFIDPDLWRRIMVELLSNAVRYSPAPQAAPIVVSLGCDEDHVRLTVRDSGIGIPENDLPHIFEMFHRGINVQNLPGSGLGLPMVKRITDLNGGNIVITSTMGQGTKATVTLPRYASKGDDHDYKQD
jgi:signal transduction histidine kinase